MNSMGGVPSIELKGGKTFFYGARLIIHLGGIGKAATKKLDATAKGAKYQYGITTKIRTTKNQLPTPWNVTYEGEMSCVHNGLLNPKALEEYKKTYMKDILARLEENGGKDVTESDIQFAEEAADRGLSLGSRRSTLIEYARNSLKNSSVVFGDSGDGARSVPSEKKMI